MNLKGRALRVSYPVYFRLEGTLFYKRCRVSITKYRQQSRRVKAKLIDPIWSQVCSFSLQFDHTGSAHFWLTSYLGPTFSLNGHCFPLYFLTGFVNI